MSTLQKANSREQEILDMLKVRQELEITEIAEHFAVSESTARRICASLDRQGKVIRRVGGIHTLPRAILNSEYEYDRLAGENAPEKDRIGQYASSLVEEEDVVFISGGTTVAQFSRHLAKRFQKGELKNVVITTNSIVNAEILSKATKVLFIGGDYRPHRRDVAGSLSERIIRGARFSKCFLGVDAIDVDVGLMVFDIETGNLDELASARSDFQYILADSHKFRDKSFITYSPITKSHTIITDDRIDPEIVEKGKEKGIYIKPV